MSLSSQYKDLPEFLAKHNAKNEGTNNITHTRIGDKNANIYGGSYIIPSEDLPIFYKLYYEHIFIKKKFEYLTEKQLETKGPLLVDFDFRYKYDVEERQHTCEHIQDMIVLYLEELKNCYVFEENKPFDIFIFEKPNVNRLESKTITKDGIHMLIGIQTDHVMQQLIRNKIMTKIGDVWDLPLENTWESVLDEGISKGKVNWQLFGSRKPCNEAYELTNHFVINYDKSDGEFMMDEKKVSDFDLKNNFYKLSAQNPNNPHFEMNQKILSEYNKINGKNEHKIKKPTSKTKINLIVDENEDEVQFISINEITDKEMLNKAVENMLKSLSPSEYKIKETHDYTQILPEKYYNPGSHLLNRQVAFALKHTDERLFLSWVMLRSKATDFEYSTIPSLYHDWKTYFNSGKKENVVTRKSIIYWAKQDAYDDYMRIKKMTIDYYIEESLVTQTEYDIAEVLFQMFKDNYVCSSYQNKGTWYFYNKHRWEIDKGQSLRMKISTSLYNTYAQKQDDIMAELQQYDPNDERREFLVKKSSSISSLMLKLKKTSDKNNIFREAMEIFYDKEFTEKMDTNKYLMGFNNGVVDFKEKVFRDGYPQDYITKTTGIDFKEYNETDKEFCTIKKEIEDFMFKLFPVDDLNKYMWEHLASCLIGVKKNQTFNIYHGSGSNGKSILTDLMSLTLGEYKGVVPTSLVTEKRGGIGGTSSEVIQLKGIRYAVMQEPSKGMKLNEGIMKELTGGDPIQARGLYQESEIFEPQFDLVVCTNNLFDIESNDDGTWRRIRKVDFVSKFMDDGEIHTDDTQYVFKKDKTLKEKLPKFAPIFASMLVKKAFDTDGFVKDYDIVMEASNKYRKGQDHISAFISEMIVKTGDNKDRIKKTEIINQFKIWFQNEQGNRKMPKGQEIYEYMDKKFGHHKSTGWHGVKIVYPDVSDELDELIN